MAFFFVESSSNNNTSMLQTALIKALKLLIILSALMISTLLMPYSSEIVLSTLVSFSNSIRCFFSSPLYICIIINSMVLLIAASSSFHRHEIDTHDPPPPSLEPSPPPPSLELPPPPAESVLLSRTDEKCSKDVDTSTLYQQDSGIDDYAKILHFGEANDHISTQKHIEGKENGVFLELMEAEVITNNQSDDTIEATWEAIIGGGKQKPKRKELKKSDTWNVHTPPIPPNQEELQPPPSTTKTSKDLRKSETFNEAVLKTRRGGLVRDPSIGMEEFNQQVEAFIKKFNDNMRLQRQESDQRFIDMIKRGL